MNTKIYFIDKKENPKTLRTSNRISQYPSGFFVRTLKIE